MKDGGGGGDDDDDDDDADDATHLPVNAATSQVNHTRQQPVTTTLKAPDLGTTECRDPKNITNQNLPVLDYTCQH